ncbi:ion channel, partial [Oryctes borbonicus]
MYLDEVEDGSASISLLLTLKRLSSIYKLIFLSPFFVISACCLSTFWTSPFGYQKVSLGCVQLIIESIILVCISTMLPGHSMKVPTLITLYSHCLIYTLVSIIISIIVINLSRNRHSRSVSRWFEVILLSNFLQRTLFLPKIDEDDDQGIRTINQSTEIVCIQ